MGERGCQAGAGIVVTAVSLLLIVAGVRLWHPVVQKLSAYAAQKRYERFSPPPGTIAFSSDPAILSRLKGDPEYVPVELFYIGSISGFEGPETDGYTPKLAASLAPPVGMVSDLPTLFLHWRRTPLNANRLVRLRLALRRNFLPSAKASQLVFGDWNAFVSDRERRARGQDFPKTTAFWNLSITSEVYRTGSLLPHDDLQLLGSAWSDYSDFVLPYRVVPDQGHLTLEFANLTLREGTPDPADPTAIDVKYQCEGQRGIDARASRQ